MNAVFHCETKNGLTPVIFSSDGCLRDMAAALRV